MEINDTTMEIRKTIWNLVVDLLSFSNNDLNIYTSADGGKTCKDMEIIINETVIRGKYTISELITHLRLNYKNPNDEVRIHSNGQSYAINIVGKKDGNCVFINYP